MTNVGPTIEQCNKVEDLSLLFDEFMQCEQARDGAFVEALTEIQTALCVEHIHDADDSASQEEPNVSSRPTCDKCGGATLAASLWESSGQLVALCGHCTREYTPLLTRTGWVRTF